jgi:hypothetical protein
MTAAQKVTIQVQDFQLEAYQHSEGGELLFTHRQIGEAVGKTKGTAQNFLANHASELPAPRKATIPERRGAIPLTPASSAVAYWKQQASQGNERASALIAAIGDKPLSEFEVVSELAAPTQETQADESELQLMAEGIEIASRWMAAAGVDKAAVAQWRLNELAQKVPELSEVVSSAQAAIAQNTSSPTGMMYLLNKSGCDRRDSLCQRQRDGIGERAQALSFLSNKFPQGRNHVFATHSISEVLPEGNAQLATSLL